MKPERKGAISLDYLPSYFSNVDAVCFMSIGRSLLMIWLFIMFIFRIGLYSIFTMSERYINEK